MTCRIRARQQRWLVLVLLAWPLPGHAQVATAERLQQADWWPTTSKTARQDYVGAARCATCHQAIATSQQMTGMARTAARVKDSIVLREHVNLTFEVNHYSYSIVRRGDESIYAVTDGTRSLSTPLSWSFGAGRVGQSYLFDRQGTRFESRVSYYQTTERLDFTPNRAPTEPRTVEDAMARPVDDSEVRRCFGCHTTAPTTTSGFDVESLIPGVTCEACRGPGRQHAEAMENTALRTEAGHFIMNPRRLAAADSIDFCGACHATFWDVQLAGERGLAALRSQPFRLESSRCWSESGGDARLACITCHDPHKPLVRDAVAYDVRCLTCHAPSNGQPVASRVGRPCPVGTVACTSCHMPKYDAPEMHFTFTDHLIRVERRIAK